MSGPAVEAALARYRREHGRYLQVAERRRVLLPPAGPSGGGIPATIQWRVKSPERVQAKLERLGVSGSESGDARVLDAVGDLAGVRVATFVEAGREPMVEAIRSAFREVDVEVKDRARRLLPGDTLPGQAVADGRSAVPARAARALLRGAGMQPVRARLERDRAQHRVRGNERCDARRTSRPPGARPAHRGRRRGRAACF